MELPRLYVNGFPKSGLHLAELMVSSLYKPANDHLWFGTNAWTVDKVNIDKLAVLATIDKGQYMKGHSGHSAEIEKMLIGLQVGMVFIHRDLRDVVVSQAYHIMSDNADLKHPARELYPHDLQGIMQAVILGVGDNDNIFVRWQNFKEWIDRPWVFDVRYEDLLHKPHRVAKKFLTWLISFELFHEGRDTVEIDRGAFFQMVEGIVQATRRTDTVTYRKGKTGQYKREFSRDTAALFETMAQKHGETCQ